MDTRLCACVRKSHFQRQEVNVSNESRWTAWCERTWWLDFHGCTHLLCLCWVSLWERIDRCDDWQAVVCDCRRCAVFIRWHDKEWCGADDWWLCYDRKLICYIERSCERGSTTPMKIGRLSVEPCVLLPWAASAVSDDRAYPTSFGESIADSSAIVCLCVNVNVNVIKFGVIAWPRAVV